jgi:spore germination cell wall hydrolase CwlJ-like protein
MNNLKSCVIAILLSALSVSACSATDFEIQNFNTYYSENHDAMTVEAEKRNISSFDLKQIHCLAENTYFEAKNEPYEGQIAVNNVVMNRVNDPSGRFGSTPCEVIKQVTYTKSKKKVCQFSWRCERGKFIRNRQKYEISKEIATKVYFGEYLDITDGSINYHAVYVNPRWKLQRSIKIGVHIFYKES